MSSNATQPFCRTDESDVWARAKFSDLMVEFAEPLMYVEPGGPADLGELTAIIKLATLCWNAPKQEIEGDPTGMRLLEQLLMSAPEPVRAALREMLGSRMTRFASVPHTIVAEVTGTSLADAQVAARAFLAPSPIESSGADPQHARATAPVDVLDPTNIAPLAQLFPELAEREQQVWTFEQEAEAQGVPAGTYILQERYCADPDCDCRRVMLYVQHVQSQRVFATIGYSFEPPLPPYDKYERQIELDWLNPQSAASEALLRRFEQEIAADSHYRDRLVQHYMLWKQVVDEPQHPLHAKIRTAAHDMPDFVAVYPRREPVRRSTAKVGANDLCPCGSGRKFKRCCR